MRFDPPLSLQRQTFILNVLRDEHVESVLDIGCGQGVLSSALARPAFQQDSFPLARFPALLDADLADEDAHTRDSALSLAPSHWIYAESELSLRRLAGLDVDGTALQDAQRNVHGVASAAEQRWRTLGVQFYRGGLQTFDERLEGFDAIVATEVIEHLHDEVLQAFGPMILGRYRPRLLVLTTPNHAFNKRFESSSKVPQTGRNFTDSTGRTTRTFRHLDHKFEWDIPECAAWCHDIATAYGYKVELGGIGEGVESDGKVGNSEPASRYASQTMVFRRRDRGRPQPCRRATLPSSLDHFERLLTIDDVSANAPELEEVPVDRTPRSRRPEYLPWLSSPRSCSDGAALFGTRASAQQDESEQRRPLSRKLMDEQVSEGLDMPLSPGLEDDGSDCTPHELVYAGTFPAFDSGSKSASTVKAMIPDEDIVSAVLDRLFALAPAQRGISDRAEVRSRLWDVWIDSRVRGLCEGKIVRLLDALRLVPPAEDEESEGSPAQRPPKRARSSGPKSSKEGGPMIVDVGNAEDPFVARKARERLVASDGREFELRLARNADYADDQADLWLVYYAAEAEGWLVETESEDPRQRSPNRGGSEGGGMAIAASWAE